MLRRKLHNTHKVVKVKKTFVPPKNLNEKNSNSLSIDDFTESTSDSMENGELGNNAVNSLKFEGEFTELLEQCYSDMNKDLQAKRKEFEQFTEESPGSATEKILRTNKDQSVVIEHIKSLFFEMIKQFQNELEKIKDVEEKMQKLLDLRYNQVEVRTAHVEGLVALNNLREVFCKRMNKLYENHACQYSAFYSKLRKETEVLQKKNLVAMEKKHMKFQKHMTQLFD